MDRKKALRDKRGIKRDIRDVNQARRKRLKKRSIYLYSKKLRQDEMKSMSKLKTVDVEKASRLGNRLNDSAMSKASSVNSESTSQTDDIAKYIKSEAVLRGRKAIYKGRLYSKSQRDSKDSEDNKTKQSESCSRSGTSEGSSYSYRDIRSRSSTNNKKEKKRKFQKQKTKRDYAKAYKKSQTGQHVMPWEKGGSIFKKRTGEERAYRFFKGIWDNKGKLFIIGIILVVVIVVVILIFSLYLLIGGLTSVIGTTTYPSSDEDIEATEEAYRDLEDKLNRQINSMESTHPGYDEYLYQVDEISHNPYELISYFTVKYGEFTYEDIEDELKELFNRQYILRVWSTTEGEGENERKILHISLTNRGIRAIAAEDFNSKKLELFGLYTTLHGNRDGVFKNIVIPEDVDHYKIPPEALSDERFRNMIVEAEKYLGYPYVWGGSNPSTSFDCSGFVCYVLNNCGNGWNVGRTTAEGLRGMTTYVRPEDARPGDIIFFQGTYSTVGASHVGIYVGDGMMIHCGNPIQYASINSSYWQQHFYEFGRMP